MSFLSRIFRVGEKPGTYAYRLRRAKELHGLSVRYVTERRDGNDDVVGRGGALALHEDTFIIDTGGDCLFRCQVADLEANDLMSGDGVIISGPNDLDGGRVHTYTVHFVYYRK